MKTKLLITSIITFTTIGGTVLLLRAIYNDMKSFSSEIYYNSTPNTNSGKHTSHAYPSETENVEMKAEVYSDTYSVSLFGPKSNNQTHIHSNLPEPQHNVLDGRIGQKPENKSSGSMNSQSTIMMLSSKSSLGESSGSYNLGAKKGYQLKNELVGTSPADDDDEEIFYVLISDGFWVLILMLTIYLGWKIWKIKTKERA
jgi:hypothetical protein